eukprot:CAMPEP_0118888940 /NCGR_PEP_ID=MMETSP1166-20130328/100_1 /TAXON_ID=1104430 /ORGANISM="Chrysoreinhardia sp, Strain CCMP3193" /LENGTH=161 /DNA_ID=CAMNT_0006827517 /DNA_START=106 /DNA_END=589 /DNA_ORIENTATION=-
MLIELKNGDTYNGRLVSADSWMNVNLSDVICTSRDGDRFWKLDECYIRGNAIKYLRIPDEIIDMVHDDEVGKEKKHAAAAAAAADASTSAAAAGAGVDGDAAKAGGAPTIAAAAKAAAEGSDKTRTTPSYRIVSYVRTTKEIPPHILSTVSIALPCLPSPK